MNQILTRQISRICLGIALAMAPAAQVIANDTAPTVQLPEQDLTPQLLYRFLLAEIAGGRGQLDLASQLYLELARDTHDPRIAKRATEMALFARNSEMAIQAVRLWNETDPNSEDAKRMLTGMVSGHGGRLEDVQIQLARALALAPANLAANLMGLNRALARLPDKAAAQAMVNRLTEPYLEHAEAHFARAQAAAIAEHNMESLTAIDTALTLRPDWEPALLFKAQLLVQTGAPAEASRLLEQAIALQPDNRTLLLAHARSLIASSQFDAARIAFGKLLESAPDDRDLVYAVALLSLQLNDPDTAEPLLLKALKAGHPEADTINLHLGQLAERRNDGEAARKWFDAIDAGKHYAEGRIRGAQSFAREGRFDDARSLLQSAKEEEGQHRFLLAEAQLLRDANRIEDAFAVVDTALRKAPDDTNLLYESAMLAERLNRLEIMEGRLRKVIALAPDHAHAYNALGYSLADRGLRLEEAEELITRAHELSPQDAFILDSLGWVRFRRGDNQGALTHLERAYAIRPDPEIAAHLGEVLWLLDRRAEAEKLLDHALAVHPDNDTLRSTAQRLRQP